MANGSEVVKPDFGAFSAQAYASKINSPAQSLEYFKRFHLPLIREARMESVDGRILLLNVACGHGYEMDFLAEEGDPKRIDPAITVLGLDISLTTLVESTRKRFSRENIDFIIADVEHSPIASDVADVGIALNAVVYKPYHMLRTLFDALKPGGKAAVNFRVYDNLFNKAFYEFYLAQGCSLGDSELVAPTPDGDMELPLKVLDYRNSSDEQVRSLDRQMYFRSVRDIRKLVAAVGFEIGKHGRFHFQSPANPNNEIDVFTLEKPVQGPFHILL